MSNTG